MLAAMLIAPAAMLDLSAATVLDPFRGAAMLEAAMLDPSVRAAAAMLDPFVTAVLAAMLDSLAATACPLAMARVAPSASRPSTQHAAHTRCASQLAPRQPPSPS
jgi:hypothetical protein